jgi:DNA adenine methylase
MGNLLQTGIFFGETMSIPHPIPYQGSKRVLAEKIANHFPVGIHTLYEPFAGSAAITLYAASKDLAREFVIGEALAPMAELWKLIIEDPEVVALRYADLWEMQKEDEDAFLAIRADYNETRDPIKLLYLTVRCVKNAVRFSLDGRFSQSHDRRRKGTSPDSMRRRLLDASRLLKGRTCVFSGDYKDCIASATNSDLVYMDPPYEGISGKADRRYFNYVPRNQIITTLERLSSCEIPFIMSYDGISGDKSYADPLPALSGMTHHLLHAGTSAQATLSGRHQSTFESLYIFTPSQKIS